MIASEYKQEIYKREDAATKIQDAFCEKHALQCGYCTPGMLIACHALVADNPHPTEDQVRDAISSNICRCTGYQQIVDAVMYATQVEGK